MTDFNPPDPVQSLDNWSAQLQRKAQRYGQFQHRLDELAVTRTSDDGRVRIEVDSNGVPTDITLTDRAKGVEPAELTRAINTTLQAAQAQLRTEVESLAGEIIGDDQPVNNILSQYQARFPDLEQSDDAAAPENTELRIGELDDEPAEPDTAQPEPQPPPKRRNRDGDDWDDDWDGRSIFE